MFVIWAHVSHGKLREIQGATADREAHDLVPFRRDTIEMAVRHFRDDAVCAIEAQQSRDAAGETAALQCVSGFIWAEQATEVTRPTAVDGGPAVEQGGETGTFVGGSGRSGLLKAPQKLFGR